MANVKLGQVFLRNRNVVDHIIETISPEKNETIIEIGPGKGILTESLARCPGKIIAVELDNQLHGKLLRTFENKSNITFINEDILKLPLTKLVEDKNPNLVKVVGNIPYYITAEILNHLIIHRQSFKFAVIMMQKEVGERILASPDCKAFGSLTIFIQYYMEVEKILNVPKHDFIPVPKVDSIILKLTPRQKPPVDADEKTFFKIVNLAFQKRRKMLHNSLQIIESWNNNLRINDILKEANITSTVRPENLSMENYANIARIVKKYL